MRYLDVARYLLRTVFAGRRMDADLEEELRDHVAREAAERMRHGVTAHDAHHEAAVALGGVTRYAEEARDARGWRWLRDAAGDVRHAVRLGRRYPGYSLATILIAASGIGATTLVFSAVRGVLLRPLPFADPDHIMMLTFVAPDDRYAGSGLDAYATIVASRHVVAAAGVYGVGTAVVAHRGEPEHAMIEYLTPSVLAVLGVNPIIGRPFTMAEAEQDAPVALLSHDIWQQRFGGDSSVVGQTVQLDDVEYSIIGVMPGDFLGPRLSGPGLWLPARISGADMMVNGQRRLGGTIILRLADGITTEQAEAWLGPRLHIQVADPTGTRSDSVLGRVTLQPLMDMVLLDRREPLLILFGAVCFVLILVTANVATLGLARAAVRAREMAVRRALGASRSRHLRQVLTETLFLMGIGGAVGVLFARVGLAVFINAGVNVLPRIRDIRLDAGVLAFALLITLVTGLAAGAAPALAASDRTLSETFKGASGGNGRHARTRAILVVSELAVSVVLLIGAGLLMKDFLRVRPSTPGYASHHRIALSVTLGDVAGGSPDSAKAHRALVQNVLRRMTAVRGVRDAAVASFLPLVLSSAMYPVEPQGLGSAPTVGPGHLRAVTPNYLPLMQIPLVAGRSFRDADDRSGVPVTIVNEAAAARWWPGESPIGKLLTWGRAGAQPTTSQVVGVAHDTRFAGTDTSHVAEFYVPYAQLPFRFVNFVVFTIDDPHLLIPELKRQIWAVDARLPIDDVQTLDEIIGDSVKEEQLYVTWISAFAVMALVLAAAGIFSVLAYAVSLRTREIGIRLALGAPKTSVGGLVIRQAAIIIGFGVGSGVIAARLLTRVLQSLLFVVSPTDTGVFVAMAAGFLLVALTACAVPLWRALTVNPARSLRQE